MSNPQSNATLKKQIPIIIDTFRRDLHHDLRADYVLANSSVRKSNTSEMARPC